MNARKIFALAVAGRFLTGLTGLTGLRKERRNEEERDNTFRG